MKYLAATVFLVSVSMLKGQSLTLNVLKKADDAFEEFSYAKAVTYYKYVLEKDNENQQYVTNQIAKSFRNLNEPDSSEVWFRKSIDLGEDDPDFYFFFAEALLSNQKYPEAKYWYEKYNGEVQQDGRSGRKLDALENFDQFFQNKDRTEIELIAANSPGLDFSPAFYDEGILFVSSRPKSSWVGREFNWDQSSFLDLYFTNDSDSNAVYFDKGINTKYHEGPLVFYNSQQSVAYTRNNFDGRKLTKDEKGVTNLKLYFAQWDSETEQWINEEPFVFNADNYSIGSPAISEDGKVLIFSSNMPGGLGESDLYISYFDGQNWSDPRNLGEKVNSKGRDGFPFLNDDQLYFSSEGREGIGGLDMYQIEFDGSSVVGEAVNLGAPFNSNRDDFGLIIRGSEGYFSSNRKKNNLDDIYKFLRKDPEFTLVIGEVYDSLLNVGIPASDVFFKNAEGAYLYTRAGEGGRYEVLVPSNSLWMAAAGKYEYKLVDSLEASIGNVDTLRLDRIYLYQDNYNVPVDSTELPDVFTVVDNRIKPYDDTAGFVDEFKLGDTLKFQNIYYDLDKYALRDTSKTILNKAASFMIEHVDVRIILSSHTDARSSDSYNMRLSRNRSKSAKDYLIWMGVNEERILTEGLGEMRLSNDCQDGKECDEVEHQLNRRTEISFVKQEVQE